MILDKAKTLYVFTVVTKAETPYLNITFTHFIELLCFDVNGAAIQASPNF